MCASIGRDRILSRFDVMQLDAGDTNISEVIRARVGKARKCAKAGLIILTGDVGSLGISIPEVDVVFLLNDIESPDMVYQQMMRVLTEDARKKCGIVIDFNIFRVMNVISTYMSQRCGHSAMTKRERLTWCISHLIPIDSDMWNCKDTPIVASRDDIIQSMIERWNETIKDTNRIVEKLHVEQIDLGEDQQILSGVYLKNRTTKADGDNDDAEPNPGLEIRHDEPATSASAREVDKSSERINLNHIIATLMYDIILIVWINKGLLPSLEQIAQCDEDRLCLDHQATLLFPKIRMELEGKCMSVLDTIIYLIKKHYSKLVSARETFDMVRDRLANILDNPAALIEFLSKHLHPSETEKKLMGEVFTPPALINEMLDKLGEICPTIWSDPSRKFLDPAAGMGNFPAFIYQRLMAGLASAIPDEDARSKHIQEKMIFMCELNPKNAKIAGRIFAKCPNVCCEDFLARDYGDVKFDVIVGNPPYNAPSANGRATGNTLYPKFLVKCETLLKKDGYQVMVHPGIWRKPGNKLHDCMFGRQIHYLEIHDAKEGLKIFGAATRYEWYVLQNKEPSRETTIRFDDGRVEKCKLKKETPFLPNHGLSIVEKIHAKITQDNKLEIHCAGGATSTKCVDVPNGTYKFPLINSTSQSSGFLVKYSSREHPKQCAKKVIFANNLFVYPFYDDGYYGVTQQGLFQIVADCAEGARLCLFLRSRIVQYIVAACKWSMFRTEYELFKYIPFPRELIRDDIANDRKLYDHFGLNDDEIARIEKTTRIFKSYDDILPDPREQIARLIEANGGNVAEEQKEPEDEFAKLTLAALREKCRALGIRGRSKMKRDELIEAIKKQSE